MENTKKISAMLVSAVLFAGLLSAALVSADPNFGVNGHMVAGLEGGVQGRGSPDPNVMNPEFAANATVHANAGLGAGFGQQDRQRLMIRDPGQISDEMRNQSSFEFAGNDSMDLNNSLNMLNAPQNNGLVASGFVEVDHGTGWAISNEGNGSFINVLLTQRPFVNETDNSSVILGNGVLLIMGDPAFNLKLVSSSSGSRDYEVMNKGSDAGTLNLTETTSLSGFGVWQGELALNSGESYSLSFATMNSETRGVLGNEVPPRGNAYGLANASGNASQNSDRGMSFWARLGAFFRFGK